jgi:hypothetical protein
MALVWRTTIAGVALTSPLKFVVVAHPATTLARPQPLALFPAPAALAPLVVFFPQLAEGGGPVRGAWCGVDIAEVDLNHYESWEPPRGDAHWGAQMVLLSLVMEVRVRVRGELVSAAAVPLLACRRELACCTSRYNKSPLTLIPIQQIRHHEPFQSDPISAHTFPHPISSHRLGFIFFLCRSSRLI